MSPYADLDRQQIAAEDPSSFAGGASDGQSGPSTPAQPVPSLFLSTRTTSTFVVVVVAPSSPLPFSTHVNFNDMTILSRLLHSSRAIDVPLTTTCEVLTTTKCEVGTKTASTASIATKTATSSSSYLPFLLQYHFFADTILPTTLGGTILHNTTTITLPPSTTNKKTTCYPTIMSTTTMVLWGLLNRQRIFLILTALQHNFLFFRTFGYYY